MFPHSSRRQSGGSKIVTQIMENTDAHWKEWGRFDPYRAVLFDEKYRQDLLSRNLDDFFETGRLHVASLMKKLKLLYPDLAFDTAVDFGSGVGRLAIPLALRFRRVIGVDISPDMLTESRKNCAKFGITNAEFVISDDPLSRVPSNVQFVHSLLVLQHIAMKRGLQIVGRLAERLAPGGVCALHVPIDRPLSLSKKIIYFGKHALPGSRYLFNLLQGKRINEPLMQMNPYPIGTVCDILQGAGVRDIWILPFAGSQRDVMFLGRKTAPAIPSAH
jgi:SAM-dependent methyltransferase